MRNRYLLLLDLLIVPLAAYASLALRMDRLDIAPYWGAFALFTAAALAITFVVFTAAGVYSRYWRLASADDALRLLAAVAAVSLLAGVFAFGVRVFVGGSAAVPRSLPLLFPFLGGALLALPRLMLRFAPGHDLRRRVRALARRGPAARREPRNVLVIGAGFTGGMIARELRNSPKADVRVIGFIDDDPAKHSLLIHGAPVLGGRDAIPDAVRRYDVSEIVIAIPSAPGRVIRELLDICEKTGAITRTMPSLHELMDGTVSVNQLRNVQIEDLLRRHPVKIDAEAVAGFVRRKRVLVTGAGGSIGSELCRQIARCNPSELSILGHGENSIFAIENELRRAFPRLPLHVYVADITRPERLGAVFARSRPDVVFHAAAHKHVPLMEGNPSEAVITNIIGTRNLLHASLGHGVRHFVLISSDKAVNPTSVMGASKRASELLVHQAAVRSGLPYVAVRFGNVLGSRGSVVHTFREQIARGGPVTVTHPDMRRYFMTIPEAVQLVLQAAVLGKGGEVFMLDMGEPVRIVDLAEAMITLSGLEVGRDIEIVYTGLRPGEKLFEEMFAPGERYDSTSHDKIFIAANASALVPPALNDLVAELAQAADRDDGSHIRQLLVRLIPEFKHQPQDEAPSQPREDEAQPAAQGTLVGSQPASARA